MIYDDKSKDSYKNISKYINKDSYNINSISYIDNNYYDSYSNIVILEEYLNNYDIIFPLYSNKELIELLKKMNLIFVGNYNTNKININIDKLKNITYIDDDISNILTNVKKDFNFPCILKKDNHNIIIDNLISLEKEVNSNIVTIEEYKDIDQVVIGLIGNRSKVLNSKIGYVDIKNGKIVIPYENKKTILSNIESLSRKIYNDNQLNSSCILSFYIENDNIYFNNIITNVSFSENNLLTTLFNYSNITNRELLDILINISIDNYSKESL